MTTPFPRLVSIETPYNSPYPWHQLRNIQYAILCNTHASSTGDVTWMPHLTNTQFVKSGFNSYISDSLATYLMLKMDKTNQKYFVGRDETLRRTHLIRQTKIDSVILYTDFGYSFGMKEAIRVAHSANIPIEYRELPDDLKKEIFGESFQSTAIPLVKSVGIFSLSVYGLINLVRKLRVRI